MNLLEIAQARYSVRSYQDWPVEEEKLLKVIEAGRLAPSACNNQPVIFIIIRDADSRRRLDQVYNRDWFLRAPVIIAVCYDKGISWKRADGKEFGDVDAAIAFDHMTLAAVELGLGTCWVGAFNADKAHSVLLLPENYVVMGLMPLGYPIPSNVIKKRKSLDQVVHWEFFGGKKL